MHASKRHTKPALQPLPVNPDHQAMKSILSDRAKASHKAGQQLLAPNTIETRNGILEHLAHGPMRLTLIAQALGRKRIHVQHAMMTLQRDGLVRSSHLKWEIVP